MPRSISAIAADIRKDWTKVNYAAVPYLRAMSDLDNMADDYGAERADCIVVYFLANAKAWRGPVARTIKAELRGMVVPWAW